MMLRTRLIALAFALPLAQRTPGGGAITKYVPPVPTPASFISDEKGVLAREARATLDARITAIQSAGLGDIAVAILPTLGDYSANQVSVEIYRTWRVGSTAPIGSARRNVGALLLIVPKELAPDKRGQCWITTGLGAEGIITDATAGAICRDSVIPHLRNKDYAGAVDAGVGGIEARLRNDVGLAQAASAPLPTPLREPERRSPWGPLSGLAALVAAAGALFGFFRWRRYKPRVCEQCGHAMRLLDERADDATLEHGQIIEEQLRSVNYDVWSCDSGHTTIISHPRWFSSYTVCRECGRKTARAEHVIVFPPTTLSTGLAEDRFTCRACKGTWVTQMMLPQIVPPPASNTGSGGSDSSGFSGGGSGGSGGGGDHSFGGSGATSGGGGGSSY